MDFNIFAIYACGSVVFLIVLICGELLFAARYARRKRFALRFVCGNAAVIIFSILLTLLYYYIEVTFNSSLISAIRVVVTYIILFVLAIAAMYFSYKESLWRCLTAGALGYICQHIAYNIYSIIDVSANFEYGVIVSLGMGGYALAVLLQLAIAAMVPFSVWLIFGRKINSFSADGIARTNAMFIIISSLAIVIILGSLGAVFGADNLGVNIVFKCLLIACCILMLILYVNIFEVKEARAERDIVLKLNENEHAHFLKLKQDMELISVKCHDIKHFIAAAGIVLYFFMNNAETTQFNADLLIQGIIAAAGAVACTVLAAIKRVRPVKLAAIIMVPPVLIVAVYGIVWGASTAAANGLTSAQTSIWSVPDKYEATDCPEQGSVEELTYATKAYATDGRTVEKRALVYLPYGYSAEREYDILYLLHGTGDDEEYWLKTNSYNKDMLDNLIYYGEIEPMIVVTPTWYVEDDCKGNLDPLTYSFKDELRNDLMPAVEGRYSTYAQSCDDAGFAASRSHRAFAGLSRGAVTTLHSVLNGCLDWFSRFGTFSGSRTPVEYFEEYACSEEQKGLSIDYWYLASGTFDFALSSQAEDYKAVLAIDSRLKEGENTSFDVFPMRYHSMGNWHLALYNFLIKAF